MRAMSPSFSPSASASAGNMSRTSDGRSELFGVRPCHGCGIELTQGAAGVEHERVVLGIHRCVAMPPIPVRAPYAPSRSSR